MHLEPGNGFLAETRLTDKWVWANPSWDGVTERFD